MLGCVVFCVSVAADGRDVPYEGNMYLKDNMEQSVACLERVIVMFY
jgi:hypothetical protein